MISEILVMFSLVIIAIISFLFGRSKENSDQLENHIERQSEVEDEIRKTKESTKNESLESTVAHFNKLRGDDRKE